MQRNLNKVQVCNFQNPTVSIESQVNHLGCTIVSHLCSPFCFSLNSKNKTCFLTCVRLQLVLMSLSIGVPSVFRRVNKYWKKGVAINAVVSYKAFV